MKVQNAIKMIAGTIVFLGTLAGFFLNKWWLLVPMFVGLNLFQYSLSGFCPLEIMLKSMGMKD